MKTKTRRLGIFAQPFFTARRGYKNKGFTLTELASVIVIVCITILLLTPVISKIRQRARVIGCEENLQKISLGLNLYANEHEGSFPPGFEELVAGGYVEGGRVFNCPSDSHAGGVENADYHYTAGHTILSPSDTPIVFDKTGNHKHGKHVLYISGDIVFERN
jgi:prepilin-type N-terminal cleavage/methylation domain-containing protein